MKSISDAFYYAVLNPPVYSPETKACLKAEKNGTLPPDSPERQWVYAAANERVSLFHYIESLGKVDFKKIEADGELITLIASSGIDGAIWLAENSKRLAIPLDRQDRFDFMHTDAHTLSLHDNIRDEFDIDDRLGWQKGPILKNTALILSVKKGWDHVSPMNRKGCLIDLENPTRFYKNKTKMGRATVALLRNGANPDIQDGCGNTALHIAVLHRDIRPIMALREAGASKTIRNNANLRPIDMLNVEHSDINPFLYQQTGNDVNCYIFTLKDRKSWLASGAQIRETLLAWPRKSIARTSDFAP